VTVLDHHHVSVTAQAAIGEPDEVGAEVVRDRFIGNARMTRVLITGDQDPRCAVRCR
jgi:hypothetical protein